MRIAPFGGVSSNNHLEIFHDGDAAFSKILSVLAEAKLSIVIEVYIFASDRVGTLVRDELIKARARDVNVTLIFDHFGSGSLRKNFVQPMRDSGIKILEFNPIWPWRKRGPLLFRDHRKIVIVDNNKAFCGSMNISDDYAGKTLGNDYYRDSIAYVEGPAVIDLSGITKETIFESEFSNKPSLAIEELFRPRDGVAESLCESYLGDMDAKHDGTVVQVLRSNTRRNLTHIQNSMEEVINRAVGFCYFTTPYFLPYDNLRRALIHAKKRGVDVRILTAGISDVPLMRLASHHVLGGFLKAGIRIYEMTEKRLHAKIATVDGIYSSVGSYNLDYWSARRNLEVNLSIIDPTTSMALKDQFYKDLEMSRELDHKQFVTRSLARRFICWLAYLLFKI